MVRNSSGSVVGEQKRAVVIFLQNDDGRRYVAAMRDTEVNVMDVKALAALKGWTGQLDGRLPRRERNNIYLIKKMPRENPVPSALTQASLAAKRDARYAAGCLGRFFRSCEVRIFLRNRSPNFV